MNNTKGFGARAVGKYGKPKLVYDHLMKYGFITKNQAYDRYEIDYDALRHIIISLRKRNGMNITRMRNRNNTDTTFFWDDFKIS